MNAGLNAAVAAVAWVGARPCVVGKSILVRQEVLDEVGGFGVISEYFAEDYMLGRAVARSGARVLLCADVLDTTEVAKPRSAVWARHRRWAMMRRRLGGPAYALEALFSPALWLAGLVASGGPPASWAAGAVLLLARYAVEAAVARRLGAPLSPLDWAMLPIRDIFAGAVFVAGLVGRRLRWRGREIEIGDGTRIVREAASYPLPAISYPRP